MTRRVPGREGATRLSVLGSTLRRHKPSNVPDWFPLLLCRPATLTCSPLSPLCYWASALRCSSLFSSNSAPGRPPAWRLATPSSTRSLLPRANPRTALARARGLGSRVATDSTGTHRNVTHRLTKDFTGIVRDSTGTPDSAMFRTVRHLAHLSRGFYRQTLIRCFK